MEATLKTPKRRGKVIGVQLSREELQILRALQKEERRTASQIIREALRAYAEKGKTP